MAGYNNYFPQTYTNTPYVYGGSAAPAQTITASNPMQPQLGAINWVQGEAGARSVPVGAGQKVQLMDSETNIFYIKSSDSSGMPLPLRVFEYKEITNGAETDTNTDRPQSKYVTHEELEQILTELKPKKEEKKNEFVI